MGLLSRALNRPKPRTIKVDGRPPTFPRWISDERWTVTNTITGATLCEGVSHLEALRMIDAAQRITRDPHSMTSTPVNV